MREKSIAGAWVVASQSDRPVFHEMEDVLSIRLRPGRYYVVTDNKKAAADLPALFATPMVIACSQQRRWFVLEGPSVRADLDRLTAIDLRAVAFPVGATASGQIGQIDVMMHARAEEAFDLFPLRSYAEALAQMLHGRLERVR